MKQIIQQIESHLESHPEHAHAKFQHIVISDIAGVSPEESKFICNTQRIFRMVLEKRNINNEQQHERQHEVLEELGYNAENIRDFADGRLFNQPIIAP